MDRVSRIHQLMGRGTASGAAMAGESAVGQSVAASSLEATVAYNSARFNEDAYLPWLLSLLLFLQFGGRGHEQELSDKLGAMRHGRSCSPRRSRLTHFGTLMGSFHILIYFTVHASRSTT